MYVPFNSVEYREHLHLNLHAWSSGSVEHMGTVGICSHLLLADEITLHQFKGGGADYAHHVGLCPVPT